MKTEYHKINSIFKRDMENSKKLIVGDWSMPEFEYLANNNWTFTEKVDGTNIRVTYEGGKISLGGRTDNAQIPAPLVARLYEIFTPIQSKIAELFDSVVFYGEGYGAKIQKGGGLYRPDQDFVLFDIRVGNCWLRREDVIDIGQQLGIMVVPIIGNGSLHDAVKWATDGIISTWGNFEAEGIVARPAVELCDRRGNRVIAKIKCRDFKDNP